MSEFSSASRLLSLDAMSASDAKTGPPPIHVSIVSMNGETRRGLENYLREAGIPSHCTRSIRDVDAAAPASISAAVVFPDDFTEHNVLELVRKLRASRPRLLVVLITREPQRFRTVTQPDGRSVPPIVMPRPSFGWDIVDAIRAHLGGKS